MGYRPENADGATPDASSASPTLDAAALGAGDGGSGPSRQIRSGLARKRRSPLLSGPAGFLSAVLRALLRDAFAVFLALAAIGLGVAFGLLLGSVQPASAGRQVPISVVHELAYHRVIQSAVLLDHDDRVELRTIAAPKVSVGGVVSSGGPSVRVWAAYPASGAQTAELERELVAASATVTVDQQSNKSVAQVIVQFLIPILLLVCLFALFTRVGTSGGGGGIAAFSRYGGEGRRGKGGSERLTFADVAGAGEAVAELREIRDYLAEPARYLAVGAAAPKGVLLVGPPGTGKTLLARAVAGEADAAFFSLSGSEFVESLVGVGAARVRDLFRKARRMAPAIVFIDELDAAGRKRGAGIGQGNDEREQTLNQILVEMDGFAGDGGLVVIGATNRPDILDPALLRPGRFDRQVVIDTPDVHGRLEILALHAQSRRLGADVSLEEIARQTPGFSGAELANVVNEAALLSARVGQGQIDQATLEEAIERVVSGPAKRHILSESERWLIAVHESSHAVASEALGQATSTRKLSIVARGRQLGASAQMLSDRDRVIVSEADLQRQLVTIVAGLAGERIAFARLSTGVNDDLHAATTLARQMVTSYGMSEALGLVTIGEKSGEVFLGASLQDLGSVGPATLNLIDNEVERLVGDAAAKAEVVLERNWSAVQETARALLEQETVSGVALQALLSTVSQIGLEELQDVSRQAPGGGQISPTSRGPRPSSER